MEEEEFIGRYPVMYHLAYGPEVWPSISRLGLLSVEAILEVWEVPPDLKEDLMTQRRSKTVRLTHATHGEVHLRDQHPLNLKMLERALTDMSTTQWLRQLNEHVFLTPSLKRLKSLYRAYSDRPRLILTLSTESLVNAHRAAIKVSRINTGAVRHVNHKRGTDTLVRLRDFDPQQEVAELAVRERVSNVGTHVLRRDVWDSPAQALP